MVAVIILLVLLILGELFTLMLQCRRGHSAWGLLRLGRPAPPGAGPAPVPDSDCPTQDCVHTGAISRAGQSIVCLPAQVVVHLEGASVPDAPDVIVG